MKNFLRQFAVLLTGLLAMSSLALAGNGALLGVSSDYPAITFSSSGAGQGAVYNGATLTITGIPVFVTFGSTLDVESITSGSMTLTANIDSGGHFSGGSFTISGTVTDNVDVITYGPLLLAGTVQDYGIIDISDVGGTDLADFRLEANDGALLDLMHTNTDGIAIVSGTVTLAGSNFSGTFDTNWAADNLNGSIAAVGPLPDTIPDAFSFTDRANVAPSNPLPVTITSGAVTITGINSAAQIAVSGDASSEYSIGCTEPYTAEPGLVTNGSIVCVRHTSAFDLDTSVNTTLTVGGVSDTFTSTTGSVPPPPDTVPDAFSFGGLGSQVVNTLVTSEPAYIRGLTASTSISVSGGGGSQYSIGCIDYMSAAGQISIPEGQSQVAVCVRHTTGATPGAQVSTSLDVGGQVGVFKSVTALEGTVVLNAFVAEPTPAVDPPQAFFPPTDPQFAATGQTIVVGEDEVKTAGEAGIGFCVAADPRETEGPPNGTTYNPRVLKLSELAGKGTCGQGLANETLEIPAYIRAFPDAGGVPRFLIATVWTTADLDGMLLSQAFPEQFINFPGGTSPACNAPLSNRPLWLWGPRTGEDPTAVPGQPQEMLPTAIQCNASRSGTKQLSNFISTVRVDENLLSSKSYLANEIRTLNKTLKALAQDDQRCGVEQQNLTAQLQAQGKICRTATIYPRVSRVSKTSRRCISGSLYEYTMKVTLTNPGGLVNGAKVKLTSGSPKTQIVGGPLTLTFGKIGAGVTTAPQTFKIRQQGNLPVDPKVILAAVDFTPATSDPTRYTKARAACETLAALAKSGRAAFNTCPADIQAKKYRGALISSGLAAAFTIYDRLERPLSGSTWSIYPLPPTVVNPAQIPSSN